MSQTLLLIDDEAPARKLLREYLSHYPELHILGEAADGVTALNLIREKSPDIVFLDVQMPGMTGLELLANLEELPLVIFCTAYDSYAIKAFELHAVDYLLKPFTGERFARAVNRLRERLDKRQPNVARLVQQLREEAAPTRYPDRIMVDRGNKYVALPVTELLYIKAEGDYSSLVTSERTYLTSYGLGEAEKRLDPDQFLRIHRSTIINRRGIREIYREGHGYDIIMTNGEVLRASRGYSAEVKKLLF